MKVLTGTVTFQDVLEAVQETKELKESNKTQYNNGYITRNLYNYNRMYLNGLIAGYTKKMNDYKGEC